MDKEYIIREDAEQILSKISLEELVGKTILITGATGLIGTYLLHTIKAFVEQGNAVEKLFIIVHRGLPEHLKEFEAIEWVQVWKGDLAEYSFCNELPLADYIIHAAGYGQPGKFLEHQDKTLKMNAITTGILLDKLKKDGKFLFLSTSEIYSGSENIPYQEEEVGRTNTTHSRACYIEGKRCGETICNIYRKKGVQAKSARVSLAYGPGILVDDARALNSFIFKGIKGNIRLQDSGNARRTYSYVSDTVEYLWNILFYGTEAIYNVGGHSHITILELAKKIGNCLQVRVEYPKQEEVGEEAPIDVFVSMEKAETEFKKKEYTELNEGLKRTIEWIKVHYF